MELIVIHNRNLSIDGTTYKPGEKYPAPGVPLPDKARLEELITDGNKLNKPVLAALINVEHIDALYEEADEVEDVEEADEADDVEEAPIEDTDVEDGASNIDVSDLPRKGNWFTLPDGSKAHGEENAKKALKELGE